MKITVCNSHNRAEEVITRAEEELALAKLIRRGANRDLVQVQKTVEDLTGKLTTATENWNALWKSFRSVVVFTGLQQMMVNLGLSLFPKFQPVFRSS